MSREAANLSTDNSIVLVSCDNTCTYRWDREMKRTIACAFLFSLCATSTFAQDKSPSCWPWPDSMEATIANPRDHNILYQDPNIRFLEVTNPPGNPVHMHTHSLSSVFLVIEPQPRGRDHKADGSVTAPGGEVPASANFPILSADGPQGLHSFEDLDTFTKHFYRVEFKKIPFVCPTPANENFQERAARKTAVTTEPNLLKTSEALAPTDQPISSPETDRILVDRADLRLIEVTIPPGATETLAADGWPSAVLFYERQPKGTDTFSDGRVVQVSPRFEGALFPTAIRMGPQPAHSFRNTDTFPAHFYRVEFKKIQFKG
jgi:hypothetical protein